MTGNIEEAANTIFWAICIHAVLHGPSSYPIKQGLEKLADSLRRLTEYPINVRKQP